MEKIWSGEARKKYPLQWIVMVNISDEEGTNKTMGEIYLVTPDKDEAYKKAIALGDSMGGRVVLRGHNPYQSELGGLEEVWSR